MDDTMDAFLNAPWFEKLFWLFFVGVPVWMVVVWIKMLVEMFRFSRPVPKGRRRAKSSGGGFSESASIGMIASTESSADSGSCDFSSDSGSDSGSDTGGGSDFSGGGGESGGGGASGGWS